MSQDKENENPLRKFDNVNLNEAFINSVMRIGGTEKGNDFLKDIAMTVVKKRPPRKKPPPRDPNVPYIAEKEVPIEDHVRLYKPGIEGGEAIFFGQCKGNPTEFSRHFNEITGQLINLDPITYLSMAQNLSFGITLQGLSENSYVKDVLIQPWDWQTYFDPKILWTDISMELLDVEKDKYKTTKVVPEAVERIDTVRKQFMIKLQNHMALYCPHGTIGSTSQIIVKEAPAVPERFGSYIKDKNQCVLRMYILKNWTEVFTCRNNDYMILLKRADWDYMAKNSEIYDSLWTTSKSDQVKELWKVLKKNGSAFGNTTIELEDSDEEGVMRNKNCKPSKEQQFLNNYKTWDSVHVINFYRVWLKENIMRRFTSMYFLPFGMGPKQVKELRKSSINYQALNKWRGFNTTPDMCEAESKLSKKLDLHGMGFDWYPKDTMMSFGEAVMWHIRSQWCNDVEDVYLYIRRFIAHMFHNPQEKVHGAVVVSGQEGCGKSVIASMICNTLPSGAGVWVQGSHMFQHFSPPGIEEALFLVLEEVENDSKERSIPSSLKVQVTESEQNIHLKNQHRRQAANFTHILMLTNHIDDILAARGNSRRFLMTRSASRTVGMKTFWDMFIAWAKEPLSLSSLVYEIWNTPGIEKWNSSDFPVTELLETQILSNMNSAEQWWFTCLKNKTQIDKIIADCRNFVDINESSDNEYSKLIGAPTLGESILGYYSTNPFPPKTMNILFAANEKLLDIVASVLLEDDTEWETVPAESDLYKHYTDYCRENNMKDKKSITEWIITLRNLLPGMETIYLTQNRSGIKSKRKYLILGNVNSCRAQFLSFYKWKMEVFTKDDNTSNVKIRNSIMYPFDTELRKLFENYVAPVSEDVMDVDEEYVPPIDTVD